jgi:N-acyl amino acid synthase of PEP-CTERM/exosortase system
MFWLHWLNPAKAFTHRFELLLADTPELRDEVFRLRHKVFCDELGFYPPNAEGRERDSHDEHSRHLLLRSLRTGASAGCIRLILASDERPEQRLPSENICAGKIDLCLFDPTGVGREHLGEISRLVLAREFRRGGQAARTKVTVAKAARGGRTRPPRALYVQLGLYLGAIALAHRLGIETLLFLIEPRLAAHFRRLGFTFGQISGPVECRGTCVLSMGHVGDPVSRLPFYMRPLYRALDREIVDALDFGQAAASFHRLASGHARIHRRRTHAEVAHGAGDPSGQRRQRRAGAAIAGALFRRS